MPSSDAKVRASVKYNSKQDCITIRPTKEAGQIIRAAAVADGKSVQAFILDAVQDKMRRDSHLK